MISEHIQAHYERYEVYRKTLIRFMNGFNSLFSYEKVTRCAACYDILKEEDSVTCIQCHIRIHWRCAGVTFSTDPFLCDRCSFLLTCKEYIFIDTKVPQFLYLVVSVQAEMVFSN